MRSQQALCLCFVVRVNGKWAAEQAASEGRVVHYVRVRYSTKISYQFRILLDERQRAIVVNEIEHVVVSSMKLMGQCFVVNGVRKSLSLLSVSVSVTFRNFHVECS